jgi:hypothetical protein
MRVLVGANDDAARIDPGCLGSEASREIEPMTRLRVGSSGTRGEGGLVSI